MLKYQKKKKFVNRGVYMLKEGQYQGSFILNMKELNTRTHKKPVVMVPSVEQFQKESIDDAGVQVTMEIIDLPNEDIAGMFLDGHFEYIETMPKAEYNQWKLAILQSGGVS